MKNKTDHHGLHIDNWKHEVESNDHYFFKVVQDFLEEIGYMQPFYSWKKDKQKRVEQEYYESEKKLFAYLKYGKTELSKDTLIMSLLKVYQTLFYKYMGWYRKSQYSCLNFTAEELQSTLESSFIESVKYYISIHQEVRTPFGSFIKNRLFIRFRGELQDLLRKRVLYEQWKDKLYERSQPTKSYEDEIFDYEEMAERLGLLKDHFLYPGATQFKSDKSDTSYDFMYNYLFIYFFFDRKSLPELHVKTTYNYKPIINEIKTTIKEFKDKVHEDKHR